MIDKETTLVRHSMRFFGYEENQEELVRMVLSGLLMTVARAVEKGEPEDLTKCSEITISLKEKHWDRTFVFELKAMEKTTTGKGNEATWESLGQSIVDWPEPDQTYGATEDGS